MINKLYKSTSEICKQYYIQNCSCCEDVNCSDNLNEGIIKLKNEIFNLKRELNEKDIRIKDLGEQLESEGVMKY